MEKKLKKQVKKKILLNFDFSDDSGDEYCMPKFSKQTHDKVKIKEKSDDLYDSPVISSEYSCRRSQLPSPAGEIGFPVMDSTHLMVDNNGLNQSLCFELEKNKKGKNKKDDVKVIISEEMIKAGGTVNGDHQHGKKIKGKENVSPTIGKLSHGYPEPGAIRLLSSCTKSDLAPRKLGLENDELKSSEWSNNKYKYKEVNSLLSQNNFSSSSSIDKFTTALENSNLVPNQQFSTLAMKAPNTTSEEDQSKRASLSCKDFLHNSDNVCASQEPSSYYVQDVSLQASLTSNEYSASSTSSITKENMSKRTSSLCKYFDNSSTHNSDNVCASQEPSSYYVQDDSIQASLQSNDNCVSSTSSPSSSLSSVAELKPSHSQCNENTSGDASFHKSPGVKSRKPQSATPSHKVGHGRNLIIGRDKTFHDLFESSGSTQASNINILAADSDSNEEDAAIMADIDGQHVVIADSEDDASLHEDKCNKSRNDDIGDENSLGNGDWQSKGTDYLIGETEDTSSNTMKARSSHIQQTSSKFSKNDESPDIDHLTSSLNVLSFHEGKSNIRERRTSSSSDDDQFEDFLNKLKSTGEDKKSSQERDVPSMDEFIVDDNASLSSELNDSQDGSNDDDDELFYIKTTNKLNQLETRNRTHFEEKTRNDSWDVDISSLDETDSDNEKFQDESKGRNEDGKFNVLTPGPRIQNKKKARTDRTPGKAKLWPLGQTSVFSGSGSDSSDDFTERNRNHTPMRGPLPAFKTPKPRQNMTHLFETPLKQKVPASHPWTAPRLMKPPTRSNVEDENFSFLKSLSSDFPDYLRHPEATRYIKKFNSLREELTTKLFKIFNEAIFESKIPSTITLEWNSRYTKTAGTFAYKSSNPQMGRVTLSNKVCDRPERVRDTLVHELCHVAVKVINGGNESHGPIWKSWSRRVNQTFPFMPMVARCHDYIIHNKYTYQCVNCKYRIGRHSKSLDTEGKVCGHCKGKFEVFLTSDLNSFNGSTATTPKTPRTPNKFALYVKECYSEVKKRKADLKHGDIMRELSKEFAEKNKI